MDLRIVCHLVDTEYPGWEVILSVPKFDGDAEHHYAWFSFGDSGNYETCQEALQSAETFIDGARWAFRLLQGGGLERGAGNPLTRLKQAAAYNVENSRGSV